MSMDNETHPVWLTNDMADQPAEHPNWISKKTIDNSTGQRKETAVQVRLLIPALGVFFLAILPRLYVLFFVTDPQNPGLGWYGDTFHHWQIAYLSKEIGFTQSFLRLWDFKGMEFFWGLLHPLVLDSLFALTGSVDILIPRLLSVVGASVSLALLFTLLQRHFNRHVALASILLATLNPVALFNDTVGMQEPLGLMLLFSGLILWPRRPALTGLLWAAAGMVRAEYWVFGFGLVIVASLIEQNSSQRLALILGWGLPILAYMKYLLDYTGNPIYPIYWNYLGGTAGKWMIPVPLDAEKIQAQWTARIALFAAGCAALWLLWKRPAYTLLLLLGLGNIMMMGIVLGIGAYIYGYSIRIAFDRLLVVPYMYLGIFLSITLLYLLPRLKPARPLWLGVGWVTILAVLGLSQLAWPPILGYYRPLNEVWSAEKQLANDIAEAYTGGAIAIPEDRPGLVYALVNYHGVTAQNLQGEMFDPFFYFQGDPFADWSTSWTIVQDWLTKNNIRLLVFYDSNGNYKQMVEREPEAFHYLKTVNRGTILVYEVK